MIIITRPSPYGEQLTEQLNQAGLAAQHAPLFRITPSTDLHHLQTKLGQLQAGDIVITVSPQVINSLQQSAIEVEFPPQLIYAAIGQKTAELVKNHTGQAVYYPEAEENSEALLALSALQQVNGKRIMILRGNNGRELLASILQSRGAQTEYVVCYQREVIDYSAAAIQQWPNHALIVVTSSESLLRLNALVTTAQRSLCRLLVTSPRIGNKAAQLGWYRISTCHTANNQILFKTITTLCHNDHYFLRMRTNHD